MVIFNTNQARHLYVATSVGQIADASVPTNVASGMSNGQLKVGAIQYGGEYEDLYFVYKNGDGIVTRSDAIKIKNIEYMNWVSPSDCAIKTRKATVALDTTVFADVTKPIGKELTVIVNLREFIGLEDSENHPIVVTCKIPSTIANNDTGKAAFYALFKDALDDAIAGFVSAPFTTSSSKNGLVITECAQSWARGKRSADPIHFEVFTATEFDADPWGTVTVAASGSTITGDYKIADLEYFTHRERADILGEIMWPNDYTWTPLVNPVAGSSTFGLLTIQYFYKGDAEDIQKSPRTMHIACSAENYATLKGYIDSFMGPVPSGSGAGA